MLGSIYVGLSGLRAYSSGIKQVSDNVANLNSIGFKSSSVSFTNLQHTRDTGGIGFEGARGGESGGVDFAGTTLNFKSGELQQTDSDLDLAVDGTGYLVLQKGNEIRYTRTGRFDVNKDGYVVLSGTEWQLATLDSAGRPVAVSIDASRTNAPVATTTIKFSDNLSSTATTHSVNDLAVYDATGVKHVWQVAFTREEGALEWNVKVVDDKGTTIGEQTLAMAGGAPSLDTSKLTFTDADSELSVLLDFSGDVTSYSFGTVSTLRAADINGHAAGAIVTLAVNDKGNLEIGYSNDEKTSLGAVAVATFRDITALRQESGGFFSLQGRSEVAYVGSEDPRVGQVRSRRLEASNVDLSREFGDLILIQRGYQASSQIISVTNDMIQQLFGIRGQG